MISGNYNVLFLCRANSARSIIAEAILEREGHNIFFGFSAGSEPRAEIHPYTADLLTGLGHDISNLHPKSMETYAKQYDTKFDFVFTVCDATAKENCPTFPGQPMTAHWGVPDPAEATGTEAEKRFAFSETYRMLRNRISIFTSLPFSSLNRLSLQNQLNRIGKISDLEDF